MRILLIAAFILLSTACATDQKILNGGSAGSDAIVISRITILPSSEVPPLINVEMHPIIGPTGMFTTKHEEPIIVTTLMPGEYSWVDMQTQYGHMSISGILPKFTARAGCINYVGDITIDFTNRRNPVLSIVQNKEKTLSDAESKYPKMFSSNRICP